MSKKSERDVEKVYSIKEGEKNDQENTSHLTGLAAATSTAPRLRRRRVATVTRQTRPVGRTAITIVES